MHEHVEPFFVKFVALRAALRLIDHRGFYVCPVFPLCGLSKPWNRSFSRWISISNLWKLSIFKKYPFLLQRLEEYSWSVNYEISWRSTAQITLWQIVWLISPKQGFANSSLGPSNVSPSHFGPRLWQRYDIHGNTEPEGTAKCCIWARLVRLQGPRRAKKYDLWHTFVLHLLYKLWHVNVTMRNRRKQWNWKHPVTLSAYSKTIS